MEKSKSKIKQLIIIIVTIIIIIIIKKKKKKKKQTTTIATLIITIIIIKWEYKTNTYFYINNNSHIVNYNYSLIVHIEDKDLVDTYVHYSQCNNSSQGR
jgi:hypothetical protein